MICRNASRGFVRSHRIRSRNSAQAVQAKALSMTGSRPSPATRPSCSARDVPIHSEAPEFCFIPHCDPIRPRQAMPAGDGWGDEVKFNGYCIEANKVCSTAVIFIRKGHDFTERFASRRIDVWRSEPVGVPQRGEIAEGRTVGKLDYAVLRRPSGRGATMRRHQQRTAPGNSGHGGAQPELISSPVSAEELPR